MVNVCINRGLEFTCYLNYYHRGKIDRLPFTSNHFHMNVKTHEDHYEWKTNLDLKSTFQNKGKSSSFYIKNKKKR